MHEAARFSRRQGFRLMLGATQAVLLGAAGCPLTGYAATVTGIPGLIAYWRLAEAGGSLVVDQVGGRHGLYALPVTFGAAGLPAHSDAAVSFDATGYATVPHDAGLALSAFSVSLWFQVRDIAEGQQAILFSKDGSGLVDGDFVIAVEDDATLYTHFQNNSAAFRATSQVDIAPDMTYHLVVTADGTGFSLWLDGRFMQKATSFTNAWLNNTRDIQIAKVAWQSALTKAVIGEVALYNRVLTDAEIIELSQENGPPVADSGAFAVPESETSVLDVVASSVWIGRRENLTVQVWNGSTWASSATLAHGTVSVRSDKDLNFAAGQVSENEAASFDFRITDATGTSTAATVGLTVQNAATGAGGTLVYEWTPQQSWITGLSLAQRGPSSVHDINKWNASGNSGASVGGSLVKSMIIAGPQKNYYWNNAPTGEPALEMWTPPPGHADAAGPGGSIINLGVQIWNHMSTGGGPYPRHVRIVMEIKTCRPADPTTYKNNGKGTGAGTPYPNFKDTFEGAANAAVKYFIGTYAGDGPGGGGTLGWWNDPSLNIRRASCRSQPSAGNPTLKPYAYNFDRPGKHGTGAPATIRTTDPGVLGVWHRLELEMKLTTPALAVAANARRRNPPLEPAHIGDGFAQIYVTKNLSNELGGGVGTRQQSTTGSGVSTTTGAIWSPAFDDVGADDDMHEKANIGGFWISLIYGGSTPAQAEGWSWIRKIQVYQHD
jgi:hypothetical protein